MIIALWAIFGLVAFSVSVTVGVVWFHLMVCMTDHILTRIDEWWDGR